MHIEILIKHWTSHLNQLLYSALVYSKIKKKKLVINYSELAPYEGAIILYNNVSFLLDYSDSSKILDSYKKYDLYFKRSINKKDVTKTSLPLNFQVNFSTNPFSLIRRMDKKILKNPTSKTELLRALDYFSLMFNDSHSSKKINKFSKDIKDNNGKIIFLTRLWSPERTNDIEEKKRRIQQNEFRINACKTIKQNFKNSIVGIQKDSYSLRIAKKLTVDNKITKKSSYISLLNSADIGIADDGLFDNPGWKIGEYVMTSKAIITTPINIHIDNFKENINYLKTKCRSF